MRDLHSNLTPKVALTPQAISTDTATNGEIVDLQGYQSVAFFLQSATLTDGTYTPSLVAGDQSDLSDGVAVTAAELIGTIAAATFAATDDDAIKSIGYKGDKRYIRLVVTSAGTTSGGTLSACAALGNPRHAG